MPLFQALDEAQISRIATQGMDSLARRALEYEMLASVRQLGAVRPVNGLRYIQLRGISDA